MPLLLLIFIIIPIIEIMVFIKIGEIIGLWATLGIVIVTAIVGTSLLRWQGLGVLQRTQTAMAKGDLPVDSVLDGVFLLVAGAFLLTPGLITDSFGFLLFIPQFRRYIAKSIVKYLIAKGNMKVSVFSEDSFNQSYHQKSDPNPIIDAEYQNISPDSGDNDLDDKIQTNPPNPSSPWKYRD